MKKVVGVASFVVLGLTGCVSGGEPNIEFATRTPEPTLSSLYPERSLSDLDKGIDEVHILTSGRYGSGSTYEFVGDLLQTICWTLDDARSVDDAMKIVFDDGVGSSISTKQTAAFVYSATKHVCPEWQVAVKQWSDS